MKVNSSTMEYWIQRCSQISGLSPEICTFLKEHKEIIEIYNKIRYRKLKLKSVIKYAKTFIEDVKFKQPKPLLKNFEETIKQMKTEFIGNCANWLGKAQITTFISMMQGCKINFDSECNWILEKLSKFDSFYATNETNLNSDRSQVLEFKQFENMINNLWNFSFKVPQMEKLLDEYFEYKAVRVSAKYFITMHKQLAPERAKFFSENQNHEQLLKCIDQLRIVSITEVQKLKERADKTSHKIDFGSKFNSLIVLLEKTNSTAKLLTYGLKFSRSHTDKRSIKHAQIHALENGLFYEEWIDFRKLYFCKPIEVISQENSLLAVELSPSQKPLSTETSSLMMILEEDNLVSVETKRNHFYANDKMIEEEKDGQNKHVEILFKTFDKCNCSHINSLDFSPTDLHLAADFMQLKNSPLSSSVKNPSTAAEQSVGSKEEEISSSKSLIKNIYKGPITIDSDFKMVEHSPFSSIDLINPQLQADETIEPSIVKKVKGNNNEPIISKCVQKALESSVNLTKRIKELIRINRRTKDDKGDLKKHAQQMANVIKKSVEESNCTEKSLLYNFQCFLNQAGDLKKVWYLLYQSHPFAGSLFKEILKSNNEQLLILEKKAEKEIELAIKLKLTINQVIVRVVTSSVKYAMK